MKIKLEFKYDVKDISHNIELLKKLVKSFDNDINPIRPIQQATPVNGPPVQQATLVNNPPIQQATPASGPPIQQAPPVNGPPIQQAPPVNGPPVQQATLVNNPPTQQAPPVNGPPIQQAPPVNGPPVQQAPPVNGNSFNAIVNTTLNDVIKALNDCSKAEGSECAMNILEQCGAKDISSLSEASYAHVCMACESAIEDGIPF